MIALKPRLEADMAAISRRPPQPREVPLPLVRGKRASRRTPLERHPLRPIDMNHDLNARWREVLDLSISRIKHAALNALHVINVTCRPTPSKIYAR